MGHVDLVLPEYVQGIAELARRRIEVKTEHRESGKAGKRESGKVGKRTGKVKGVPTVGHTVRGVYSSRGIQFEGYTVRGVYSGEVTRSVSRSRDGGTMVYTGEYDG